MNLHAAPARAADLETWFLARGWLLIAACFAITAIALAYLVRTDNPQDGPDEPTCPPVDLDTELRKLIEEETRRGR